MPIDTLVIVGTGPLGYPRWRHYPDLGPLDVADPDAAAYWRDGFIYGLPDGRGDRTLLGIGDDDVVLVVRVVDAVCPHRGGPLADGQTDGRQVLCPLHLTAFDLETGCAAGTDYVITTYPAHVDESGRVIVAVPADHI